MNSHKIQFFLLALIVQSSLVNAVCPLGELMQVTGSPFTAGSFPVKVVFSPLVSGNLFAAVGNLNDSTIGIYSVNQGTGFLSQVPSSPFFSTTPRGLDFSPVVSENLFLAVANISINMISIFATDPTTGALHSVEGSPFNNIVGGGNPFSAVFTDVLSGGLFLGVTNQTTANVSMFSVNQTTGALTPVGLFDTGTPTHPGTTPTKISFSPGSQFAAVINQTTNNVSIFSVDPSTGALTLLNGGEPVPLQGTTPAGVSFSPIFNGHMYLAISMAGSNWVEVYSVDQTTGALTPVPGSPFSTGMAPSSVSYTAVTSGALFAGTANTNSNSISAWGVNPSNGAFIPLTSSPFPGGGAPISIAATPVLPTGNLFVALADSASSPGAVSVFLAVAPLSTTITTPTTSITPGSSITLTVTATGVPPFNVGWSDGFTQTGVSSPFSRVVSPTVTTTYQITSFSDNDGCIAGPSNAVTITVALSQGPPTTPFIPITPITTTPTSSILSQLIHAKYLAIVNS